MKVKLNQRFNLMMTRASQIFQARLAEESQKMLTEKRRPYPRATIRSDGSIATSPRDVVDTGELVKSFGTALKKQNQTVIINQQWIAEHAAIVYLGWTSSTGLKIPAWKWMEELTNYVSFEKLFQEACFKAKNEVLK